MAALSHPNILALHDFGRDHGIAFAVMELLEGEPLDRCIGHGPHLEEGARNRRVDRRRARIRSCKGHRAS